MESDNLRQHSLALSHWPSYHVGITNVGFKDFFLRRGYQCGVWRSLPEKRGRFTENLSIYPSSPAPNSPLQSPSNFGAIAFHWLLYFLLFSFFLIFNRMDAWSLMRGDAFIHFVSGSRRVNIRLGVLLLIPKSPHINCSLWMRDDIVGVPQNRS